jgi:ABC-2 type transport system ATP-binding protein
MNAWDDSRKIAARVGYLPGDVRFRNSMRGGAFLKFCNSARGGGHDGEIDRLAKRFDLKLDRRIRHYSRGMKQKLGLIQALMHRPDLLILDEPATALDPLVQQTLYDELRTVAAEGRTVLFSSHTLSEVDQLCDRVAVIRAGRLVESCGITELRARAPRRVTFKLIESAKLLRPVAGEFHRGHSPDDRMVGSWAGSSDDMLTWLQSMRIDDIEIGPPTLEELFHRMYRDDSTEGTGA